MTTFRALAGGRWLSSVCLVSLVAVLSACGSAVAPTPSLDVTTPEVRAEFSVFSTYPDARDVPDDPELVSHLKSVLGPDASIRHVTELEGSDVYIARGDSKLCLATDGEFLAASCNDISTPRETWVAMASNDPGATPYLLTAATDGYTDGQIGEQSCSILSNVFIVINPKLTDSVKLTGEGMEDAVFEGQGIEVPVEGRGSETNECFDPEDQ